MLRLHRSAVSCRSCGCVWRIRGSVLGSVPVASSAKPAASNQGAARNYASKGPAASGSSGGGAGFKFYAISLAGLTVSGLGGCVLYADTDGDFRRKLERNVPGTKHVFDDWLKLGDYGSRSLRALLLPGMQPAPETLSSGEKVARDRAYNRAYENTKRRLTELENAVDNAKASGFEGARDSVLQLEHSAEELLKSAWKAAHHLELADYEDAKLKLEQTENRCRRVAEKIAKLERETFPVLPGSKAEIVEHEKARLIAYNRAYEDAKLRLSEFETAVEDALYSGYDSAKAKLVALEHSAEDSLKSAWRAALQLETDAYENTRAKLENIQGGYRRLIERLVELEQRAVQNVTHTVDVWRNKLNNFENKMIESKNVVIENEKKRLAAYRRAFQDAKDSSHIIEDEKRRLAAYNRAYADAKLRLSELEKGMEDSVHSGFDNVKDKLATLEHNAEDSLLRAWHAALALEQNAFDKTKAKLEEVREGYKSALEKLADLEQRAVQNITHTVDVWRDKLDNFENKMIESKNVVIESEKKRLAAYSRAFHDATDSHILDNEKERLAAYGRAFQDVKNSSHIIEDEKRRLAAYNRAYADAKLRLSELEKGMEDSVHTGFENVKDKLATLEHNAEDSLLRAWHAALALEQNAFDKTKAKLEEVREGYKSALEKLVELEQRAVQNITHTVDVWKNKLDNFENKMLESKEVIIEKERKRLAAYGRAFQDATDSSHIIEDEKRRLAAYNRAYADAKLRLSELEKGMEDSVHSGFDNVKDNLATLEHNAEDSLLRAWHAALALEQNAFEKTKAKLEEVREGYKSALEKLVHMERSDAKPDKSGKPLDNREKDNKDLVDRLQRAIQSAENHINTSLTSKQKMCDTVSEHTDMLRGAVDNRENENKWAELQKTHGSLMRSAENDRMAEQEALNYLDSLKKVISDGRQSPTTVHNPILDNADETLKDLTYRWHEAKLKAQRKLQENVVMNEYRRLVQQSRADFASELKSLIPNVEFRARKDELTPDELNTLLAHAHMKVDSLQRKITDQQVKRKAEIVEAVEKHRLDEMKQADERVKKEIEQLRATYAIDLSMALTALESDLTDELRHQLDLASEQHEKELSDAMSSARGQWEVEMTLRMEQMARGQREGFEQAIASSLARVSAIESALEQRSKQDEQNRRSKQLWLACQSLVDSVVFGKGVDECEERGGDRRKPLANELIAIREAAATDEFIAAIFESFSDEALFDGTYTRDELVHRFNKVRSVCSRTAFMDGQGASMWHLFWSALGSLFVFDLRRTYPADERRDYSQLSTHALLARARYHLEVRRDLETAVKKISKIQESTLNVCDLTGMRCPSTAVESSLSLIRSGNDSFRLMQQLRGEPARVARDWIFDAKRHLETLQAAEMLLTHAAATSMRTVY